MSSRPAKRARLNTDADAIGFSKIPELINSIDPNTIARLLITAAKAHPDIASLVQREVDFIAAAERAKVVDFDHLYQSVWETLNVTYDRLRDSHAYEMAGEATRKIEACIREIRTGCPKTASFKTKENALETLRKIGKSICCSNGVVGREVRKGYQYVETFESTMLEIVESLTYEELERLRPWRDDKLVELQRNADGCCIFEGLGKVIQLWGGDEEGEGEGSSDGSEEVENQSGAE